MTLTVDAISKDQFNQFRKVQYGGNHNMLAESMAAAREAELDQRTYDFILENYEALEDKHGEYEE